MSLFCVFYHHLHPDIFVIPLTLYTIFFYISKERGKMVKIARNDATPDDDDVL